MTSESWPTLPAELSQRMMLDQDGFLAMIDTMAHGMGERDYEPDLYEHAIGYPWPRPAESFVLRDGEVEPWDPALRDGRSPVLAIGSNAAPNRLALKVAHFEDAEDRLVGVESGVLEDFDVGPAAVVTGYGSLPATIFPSPGTRVSLAVLWVTDTQLTQLTWSEVGYWLGRLSGVRFNGEELTAYVYLHRLGTFAPDGEPVALAAVPAENRSAPEYSQRELLDRAAEIIGFDSGEALVEQVFRDIRVMLPKQARLREHGLPFESPHWSQFTWIREPGSPTDPATAR